MPFIYQQVYQRGVFVELKSEIFTIKVDFFSEINLIQQIGFRPLNSQNK